ncbi:MAG: hypothetical protein AMS16_04320 [Planctomycetes bacterium DG_58]|nr:MAG: hypothetical protein AMS16_04320 [Planctomycetes bacterium DG_58]
MFWALTVLSALVLLALVHGVYRILARFESVRKVVISYHILAVLVLVLVFALSVMDWAVEKGWIEGVPALLRNETFLKILIGMIVFFAVLVVLRLVDLVLVDYLLGKRLGVHISVIARHIAIVILLAVAIVMVLGAFEVPITPLLATSAIGTAIIGLALQDVLGNVIAGVALQAERPFAVGDWVEIGEIMGRVVEMNWRATKLATLDDDYVILPNSTVARNRIRNFAAPRLNEARHLYVGVEYGQPPGKVKSVLMEAVQGADGVLSRPTPKVWVVEYGDFAIKYEIKFWLDRFADHQIIQDNVMTRIWYLFRRNDITIPFPIRNVFHYRLRQGFVADVLQPGSDEVTAILQSVQRLQPLSREELSALSYRLTVALYTADEVLVREDEPGASFLIIASGKVSVRVDGAEVATLTDRDHFGEMSLLTGEPRNATVVALAETRVLIIDRDCFESIIKANPAVADALSKELERIHAENLAKLQAKGVADPGAKPQTAGTLLKLVRRFFGLKA